VHHERQGSRADAHHKTRGNGNPKNPWKPGGSVGGSLPQSSQRDSADKPLKKSAPEKIDRIQRREEAIQATTMFDKQDKLKDSEPNSQSEMESTNRWLPGGALKKRPPQSEYSNQDKPLPGKRENKGKNSAKRSGRSSRSGQVWDEPAPYGTTDPRYR